MQHALSFDVEESFQVQAAADGGVGVDDWCNYERRLPAQVNRVLDLLAEHHVTATFFVLGWVAQHEPDVVRRIAAAGHEIASHGMGHAMLSELTAEAFRGELRQSRALLEDLARSQVTGFRAPTFSIRPDTLWALDVLAEEGFAYDSSIYPIRHDRYGIPGAPAWLHRAVGPAGGSILEIPPLSMRLCGLRLAVGGGGYLRLFPSGMVRRGLKLAEGAGQPGMIYLHPWELDFQMIPVRHDSPDLHCFLGWQWRCHNRFRREFERNAEYISILDIEQPLVWPLLVQLVGLSSQGSSDNLFAE